MGWRSSQLLNCTLSMFEALGIGNVPFGNNVVLTGPAGIGKSVFCKSLVAKCRAQSVQVIYVTLDADPRDIRSDVQNSSFEHIEDCTFIDGYSWLLGRANENTDLSSLYNINELSIRILNAINAAKESLRVIVFDSLSTLFLYNSEIDIERFIQINMARIRQSHSLGLWTVTEGIHNPAFYNSLRHLADGVVEMRFEEEYSLKRFIRVHTFRGLSHSTAWLPFTIRSQGEFVVKPSEQSEEVPSYLVP